MVTNNILTKILLHGIFFTLLRHWISFDLGFDQIEELSRDLCKPCPFWILSMVKETLLFVFIPTGGFDHSAPLNSVERYDPQKNEWIVVNPMTTCRGGVGAAVLAGKLYAIGGHDGTNYLSSAECYCPYTNRYEIKHSSVYTIDI